jgi:phosphoribosylglycinamide formyltransferase-1
LSERPRIAVAVSGSGRSLGNLIERSRDGRLNAEVALTIADRGKLKAIDIAEAAGVPVALLRPRQFASPAAFSEAVFEAVEAHECRLLVLAGFLRLLPIPERWESRVINIHPSLLPKHGGAGYYGERVHASVLEAGDTESGCTVHYVDNEFDNGPPILQRRVPVLADDTVESLAARVFAEECEALPQAVELALGASA